MGPSGGPGSACLCTTAPPGLRGGGGAADAGTPRPAAISLQLRGGPWAGNSPGRRRWGCAGPGWTKSRRSRAAGLGPQGGGRRGAYLPWCCRAVAAAAASCWLGEAGRWEGAQPASRRGRSRASGWSALIASVTWPRTLPAPVDCRPTHRPAGGGGPVAAGPGLLPGPCVLLAGFQVRLSGTSGLAPVAHLFGTARPQCPRELGI